MYSIYPKIISKISAHIKKLNLSVLTEEPKSFVKKKKRFYWAIGKMNRKKVFFKSLLKREKGIKNRFKNEINFLKILNENPWHPLLKFTPKILDFSTNDSFPYLLYQFLPGKRRERKDKFSLSEIREIVKLMKLINSSKNIFTFIPKKAIFNFHFYKKTINFLFNQLRIEKKLRKKIENFIKREKRIFYLVKPTLTHGDFSEANLIFQKGKIKIVDWEHAHLRNPYYDLVSFWTKRKKYPKEKREIIKSYLIGKKEWFPQLFKLALIEICLRDLLFFKEELKILKSERKKDEKIKKAIKSIKEEIKDCLKLLRDFNLCLKN